MNTDFVIDIDDEAVVRLARLFNEPGGRALLASQGVPTEVIDRLDLLGFSGIANLLAAIKLAKALDLEEHDLLLTVLTDSMDLYRSRLEEMHAEFGPYDERRAAADHARHLLGATTDHMLELTSAGRRRIHNLKYFTWVEQQGRQIEELIAQAADPDYWTRVQRQVVDIDRLIEEFNAEAGIEDG
jgi:hypothetical protein